VAYVHQNHLNATRCATERSALCLCTLVYCPPPASKVTAQVSICHAEAQAPANACMREETNREMNGEGRGKEAQTQQQLTKGH